LIFSGSVIESTTLPITGALVGQLLDGLFAVGAADAADHSQAVLELGALRAAATFRVEAVAIAGIVTFRINIGKDRKC